MKTVYVNEMSVNFFIHIGIKAILVSCKHPRIDLAMKLKNKTTTTTCKQDVKFLVHTSMDVILVSCTLSPIDLAMKSRNKTTTVTKTKTTTRCKQDVKFLISIVFNWPSKKNNYDNNSGNNTNV